MDEALTIGKEKTTKVIDARGNISPLIGIAHHNSMRAHFHQMTGRANIAPLADSILGAGERLVFNQLHATRMINESITRNTRDALIGFRKASVYDNEFATCL